MDEELEQPVLSFLNGEEGWDTDYSSISEFKHHLKESDLVDEELEQLVLSFLNGEEGWDTDYSSISEFKHHLKEDTLADHEELEDGWVFWRENEQQLNNTTHLQHKITTLFKHQSSPYIYYDMLQFWGVMKVEGRRHYLSASHQPFYVSHLRKGLCWFRNLCRDHVYRVEEDGTVEEAQLGGVGRAYRNKHPESTPDLRLYSTNEFPLRDHAARCGLRFYLALPLFDLDTNECCGVLELLSRWPGMDANLISSLIEQLQIAGLRSAHINFNPITYVKDIMPDKYKQQVDTEIKELLETVIQALPRLSLAQVWVYCKQCVNFYCMERASFIAAPIGRSTIKRACRDHGIKRWPCTEKQTKTPCIYEKEKEQDSHQDEQPSSSGSLQLLDTSLHQNGPCTKTESLIVLEEVEKGSPKKKAHKAVVKERKVMSFDSLPLPLKILCSYAENELIDGRGIPVDLDDEVFGDKCKIYVHLDDIIPFCDLEPISRNCIVVYIWQLYNKIKKENTLRRFQFVNPFTISYVPNGELTQRAYKLADRLIVASPDQLVLVPCNVGEHWILTVIEPYKNVVYMLDPISHCIRDEAWKCAVDQAMIKFNANLEKGDTGQPTWEAIKVPLQPDFKQCGYYVMRFMKEIVQGLNAIDSGSLSSLFVNEEYSRTDIDEVRIEWTNCLTNTRVGRSTIKRASRYHSIGRWPCNEKQTRNPSLYEQDSQQDVQPSSSGNLRQLDASLHQNGPRTNTENLIVQEEVEKVMMIKVRSEEDIIKFELCLSLGVGKLLEEVATRLNLKMGTFKLKYLDEDKDEILVTCDADLQLCLKSQKTMGKNCIELLLR